MIEADERLLARVNRTPRADRKAPEEVDAAMAHVSKQFQLWDVKREEVDVAKEKREPIEVARTAMGAGGSGFQRILAESTRALAQFVPASLMAQKAFVGLRALKRQALRKPYRPSV